MSFSTKYVLRVHSSSFSRLNSLPHTYYSFMSTMNSTHCACSSAHASTSEGASTSVRASSAHPPCATGSMGNGSYTTNRPPGTSTTKTSEGGLCCCFCFSSSRLLMTCKEVRRRVKQPSGGKQTWCRRKMRRVAAKQCRKNKYPIQSVKSNG